MLIRLLVVFVIHAVLCLCVLLAGVECIDMGGIPETTTTTNPIKRALSSVLILETTDNSSTSPSCVAMQLAPTYLLTTVSCDTTGKIARLLSTRASSNATESPSSWMLNATGPAIAIRNSSVVVGSSFRILELQKPISDNSRSSLTLPVGMLLPPTPQLDENGTMLLVDLDAMQVRVARKVIFVDPTDCQLSGSANSTISNGNTSAEKACMVPGKGDDRKTVQSKMPWFIVLHEAFTTTGDLMLLLVGLGDRPDQRDPDHHVVTWLSAALHGHISAVKQLPRISTHDMTDESRILGGSSISHMSRSLQFVVGLRVEQFGTNGCGGSLIAPYFVLTAAHCGKEGATEVAWVSIGAFKSSGDSGEIIRVRRRYRHPDYNSKTFANDIMLLELERPSCLKSITLDSGAITAKRGTIFGYGVTDTEHLSTSLRQLDLPLGPDNAKCAKAMGESSVDNSLMCAGGEKGRDACVGDSGGPLVLDAGTSKQRLIGVISSGKICGGKDVYGMYAKVSSAAKFIKNIAKVGPPRLQVRHDTTYVPRHVVAAPAE